MDQIMHDLRFALRMLTKRPMFSLIAILILAIGIGASTTIQILMRSVLFDPLAGVSDQDRLMVVAAAPSNDGEKLLSFSYPELVDVTNKLSKSQVIADSEMPWSLDRQGQPERVWGALVSRNYFAVLGTPMIAGRGFVATEEGFAPASQEVVMSHALWQRAFGGDPAIVGKNLTLNGKSFSVVGITPKGFIGGEPSFVMDLWAPVNCVDSAALGAGKINGRGNHWLQAKVRLASGVTREEAQAELQSITRQIHVDNQDEKSYRTPALFPLWRAPGGGAEYLGPVLFALAGLVAVVMLVACANVASMLLARSSERHREIAVRLTVGAGRGRLIRQLLMEGLLLSLCAGVGGVGISVFAPKLVNEFVPPIGLPIVISAGLDLQAILFALALAVFSTFIFALLPALQASRVDVASALKEGGRGLSTTRGRARLRSSLVVIQVAFSLLLLVCAGMFARSALAVKRFHPGFSVSNVLVVSLDHFSHGYTVEQMGQFTRELLPRLRSIPGVTAATLSRWAPLGLGGTSSGGIGVDGYQGAPNEEPMAYCETVGPEYFATLEIPLVAGREFDVSDDTKAEQVIIINETVAKRYWAGRNPIGDRVNYWGTTRRVVGIARDSKFRNISASSVPVVFMPVSQVSARQMTILVRSENNPSSLAGAVKKAVAAVDPRLPTYDIRTLAAQVSSQTLAQRLGGYLTGVFGLVALLLAAVGLYGVVAQIVVQRTHEFGVRVALGARPGEILSLVLARAGWMTGLGLIIGLLLSIGAFFGLRSLLLGVSGFDFATVLTATLILSAVAVLASIAPARRASSLNPIQALRCE